MEPAPVRQLDVPVRGPRPSAPIPGSTRDRVQQQANRMLPGIVDDNGGKAEHTPKPRPVRNAWGEAASAGGFALALSLRSKGLKWLVRVLMLVAWFVCPLWVSGVITLLAMGWVFMGLRKGFKWLVSKAPKKELDTCQCGH